MFCVNKYVSIVKVFVCILKEKDGLVREKKILLKDKIKTREAMHLIYDNKSCLSLATKINVSVSFVPLFYLEHQFLFQSLDRLAH